MTRRESKKALPKHHAQKSKAKKKCGQWKSGNPKSGFPLFHCPESPAAQGKERPFTQNA
jgi:hypothetical protein